MGEFSYWYYNEMLFYIVRAARGYMHRTYFGFSIPFLRRTIFAPWKRDVQSTEGLSLPDRFRVFSGNLVSRFFGAVVRMMTMFVGTTVIVLEFFYFLLFLLLWVALPFLIVIFIGYGFRILFLGAL